MNITRLRGGNAQFPEDKEIGDVIVLSSMDIFCWDGKLWQLVGGRFLPKGIVETFINYIDSGWPDPQSAQFDLPTLIDLEAFVDYGSDDVAPADPKMADKFIKRVIEVAKQCEKNLQT
jgi:hypothetical protein